VALALVLALVASAPALAPPARAASPQGSSLSEKQQQWLDENWGYCLRNKKGPYTANMCVCKDGKQEMVRKDASGKLIVPCGGSWKFCEAFRSTCGEALASEGMYVGNLFERDLYEWSKIEDHHDLVRGYILEKFFIETHPDHKLAVLRSYGGLAGAEYEARSMPRLFERYLALDGFAQPRHYLLAYELQRRFFVRNDQGQITKARNMATAIQGRNKAFKPLRDMTHNQISAALIPRLVAWRDGLAEDDELRASVDELIAEIEKLTSLDESALLEQLPAIEDDAVRAQLQGMLPPDDADDLKRVAALAAIMVTIRDSVEAKRVSPADRRRLIDVAITAAAVIQARGVSLLDSGGPFPARAHVRLLLALGDAAYGAGLLLQREREAAAENLAPLLEAKRIDRKEFEERLEIASRVVEWAQRGTLYSFQEVLAPWAYLVPEIDVFPDDVRRPGLEPGARAGDPARGTRSRRLLPQRDRGPARDPRRPPARRRHLHPGRGERGLPRAAAGTRAGHPQRGSRTGCLRTLQGARRQVGLLRRHSGRARGGQGRDLDVQGRPRRGRGVSAQRRAGRQGSPGRRRAPTAHRPRAPRPLDRHGPSLERRPAQRLGYPRRSQGGLPR
jgi:hypothetical protein